MHLQSLELLGFKSLPTKRSLISTKARPRSSTERLRKINVLDVIRWGMATICKSLRKDEMADVIFDGSDTRAGGSRRGITDFHRLR
jgi:hypothetical protein